MKLYFCSYYVPECKLKLCFLQGIPTLPTTVPTSASSPGKNPVALLPVINQTDAKFTAPVGCSNNGSSAVQVGVSGRCQCACGMTVCGWNHQNVCLKWQTLWQQSWKCMADQFYGWSNQSVCLRWAALWLKWSECLLENFMTEIIKMFAWDEQLYGWNHQVTRCVPKAVSEWLG